MTPLQAYIRAAAHCVYVADRVGELLCAFERTERWPYDPPTPAMYLANWLYRSARLRLAVAAAQITRTTGRI